MNDLKVESKPGMTRACRQVKKWVVTIVLGVIVQAYILTNYPSYLLAVFVILLDVWITFMACEVRNAPTYYG